MQLLFRIRTPLNIKGFFLLLFLFSPFFCFAQSTDVGLWSTISIEKEFGKKLAIELDQEMRLKGNFSELNSLFTNISASYKLSKGLKIGVGYRLIEKNMKEGYFSYRNRFMADIAYKYKLTRLSFQNRFRLQSEFRDINSSDNGKVPEWLVRNKIDVKYDLKKWEPFIGIEGWYQLNDPRNSMSNFCFQRIRIYSGVDYNLSKKHSIGIYGLVQKEVNVEEPENAFIIGIQYTCKL